MSTEVTTAFVQQYSANVQMLSQQMGSRLRDAVRVENMTGKNAFFDQVGKATAQKRTTRHADTPQIDTPHARRRVSLVDYEYADLIDDQDKVRMLIDPTSAYAQAAAAAMGRAMDDEIIASALGTAFTGETGSTSTALPAGQQIADGSADMSLAKLREAKKILDLADVDPSIPRYIACGPDQIEALLADTNVTSSDFNTVKALVQGEVNQFMGFNFIRSERLVHDGTSRECYAYAQTAVGLALPQDITVDVGPRRDKNNSMQVYVEMSLGAVRLEDEQVVQILCNE